MTVITVTKKSGGNPPCTHIIDKSREGALYRFDCILCGHSYVTPSQADADKYAYEHFVLAEHTV